MVTLWEKSLKICESLKQPCKRQFNVGQSKIAQEEEENARLERQKTPEDQGKDSAKLEQPKELHESIKSLKKAIKKAWDEMPDDMVKRVVDSWPGRLQACIDAEGGYIE